MAEKQCDHDTSSWDVERRLTSGVQVNLPGGIRRDLGMLRRLHHLLVDITADRGFKETLAEDAETRLEFLSSDAALFYVYDLLNEACYPKKRSKTTKTTKKSKKVAKPKRK